MEFKIQRYQGDDDGLAISPDNQIDDLFQARIEQRRQRKLKQLQESAAGVAGVEPPGDENIKRKKEKSRNAESDVVSKKKKKKKKDKTSNEAVDSSTCETVVQNENVDNNNEDSNGVSNIGGEVNSPLLKRSSPKKKKKKKHSLVESADVKECDETHPIENDKPKKVKKKKRKHSIESNITNGVIDDGDKSNIPNGRIDDGDESNIPDGGIDDGDKSNIPNGGIDDGDKVEEEDMQCNDADSSITEGSSHLNSQSEDANHETSIEGTSADVNEDEDGENNKAQVQSKDYFPVLGRQKKVKKTIAKRSLPRWLNEPVFMSADISLSKVALTEVNFISETLSKNLRSNDIEYLFPVQNAVIQEVMTQNRRIVGKYPPRDICVQAPTGSGKTLAYVLPIVDVLSKYIVRQLYCLVVVPSKDLAVQVHRVFDAYVKGTNLKVALASGVKTFSKEQETLVTKGDAGCCSKVDIVVSTPGRLVDHLKQTPGFTLKYLRFLVVDEADRLLGQDYSSWLNEVKTSVHSPNGLQLNRPKIVPINASAFLGCQMPFQKLLFSATLTQNPEKLASLELFHPRLFTSKQDISFSLEENDCDSQKNASGENERFIIPEKLEEKMVVVEGDQKPLVLIYLMLNLNKKGVLCFTNSISATHRLCLLLQSFQGFTVAEFSSNLSETQRKGIIRDFNSGKVDLLISSDAMARGMDIDSVKFVVNYDTAANAKTYVHRVGRTARAGKEGCALTVLLSKEVYHFKLMMKKLSGKLVPKMNIPKNSLSSYQEEYEKALSTLHDKISLESRNTNSGNFTKRT